MLSAAQTPVPVTAEFAKQLRKARLGADAGSGDDDDDGDASQDLLIALPKKKKQQQKKKVEVEARPLTRTDRRLMKSKERKIANLEVRCMAVTIVSCDVQRMPRRDRSRGACKRVHPHVSLRTIRCCVSTTAPCAG